jgi:hypothetical protein
MKNQLRDIIENQFLTKQNKIKHINYMKKLVMNDKTITIKELHYLIKNKFSDFNISERHLDKILDDNYITLKLKRLRYKPLKRYG